MLSCDKLRFAPMSPDNNVIMLDTVTDQLVGSTIIDTVSHHVSREDNAIGRVRPSVYFYSIF